MPRQQTLPALTDWSYELLSNQGKALFLRPSVFAGGWTLEAAEAGSRGPAWLSSLWRSRGLLVALAYRVNDEIEDGARGLRRFLIDCE